MTAPTQVRHPWRTTIRTVFQAVVTLAASSPLIYEAATNHSPGEATGAAAVGLAVAGALTRVMALPSVESFLVRFVPFLSAAPKAEAPVAVPAASVVPAAAPVAPPAVAVEPPAPPPAAK